MRDTTSLVLLRRCARLAACVALIAFMAAVARPELNAQSSTPASEIPQLVGVWDGGPRSRPVNGPNMPWTSDNFPVLNERALAYQKVFDEALAPKYDCVPSTPPALQYDPYMMEVVQWPDRVMFRYEKDDQLRTVWLDGREASVDDFSVQGISVGYYEDNALHVETTHYAFDVTGFDDYNGIPSSQQKRVLERYWREGDELKVTVTVEDPLFLRESASYTTRWLPAAPGSKLQAYDCDPEEARHAVRFLIPKYR